VPPGRIKDFNGARSALNRSISRSIQSTCASVTVSRAPPGPFSLDVEQIVLDAPERRVERSVARGVQADQADGGVDFVERAVRGHAQVVFLAAVAGAERRRAVVAGAGVDAIQYDHGVLLRGIESSEFRRNDYSILAENDEEKPMRFIAIMAIAALLAVPLATSASWAAQNTDISAAKKKAKPKKEKVEYMRAVPSK